MKTKNQPLKIGKGAIYARVSSQRQKEGETIDSQLSSLLVLEKQKGYEISEDFQFLDNGISGSLLNRPALDQFRDIIRAEPIDVVFIYSPDRLSRAYAHQIILREEFRKYGVNVCFLNSTKEATTPEEKMLENVQGIFAEYERALILDRSRRGRYHKAKMNDPSILPRIAYGYERKKNDHGCSTVIIKEEKAKIVKEIFRLFVYENLSLMSVATQLTSIGIKSPKGNSQWHGSTVRGILKNQAYIGNSHYGKTERCEGLQYDLIRHCKNGTHYKSKCARRVKPETEWLQIDMPPIISESDFELAQYKLGQNVKKASRNTRDPGLLQGLIICSECGEPFYKRSRKYDNRRVNIYHCRSWNRKDVKKCANPSIKQEDLDDLVFSEVLKLLKNPSLIQDELARRTKEAASESENEQKEINFKKELSKISSERDRLLDAYQGGIINLDDLRKRNHVLDKRKMDLEKALKRIQAVKFAEEKSAVLEECLETIIKRMDQTANNLTFNEKRKVIRLLVEKVTVSLEEITITHCISPRMLIQETRQLQTDGHG